MWRGWRCGRKGGGVLLHLVFEYMSSEWNTHCHTQKKVKDSEKKNKKKALMGFSIFTVHIYTCVKRKYYGKKYPPSTPPKLLENISVFFRLSHQLTLINKSKLSKYIHQNKYIVGEKFFWYIGLMSSRAIFPRDCCSSEDYAAIQFMVGHLGISCTLPKICYTLHNKVGVVKFRT